jgi:uncharacterized protein YqeY
MPVVDEKSEIEVAAVRGLLPLKMDEGVIRLKVKEFLGTVDGNVSIGMVMNYFKVNHAGQYDGSILSRVVREEIGK